MRSRGEERERARERGRERYQKRKRNIELSKYLRDNNFLLYLKKYFSGNYCYLSF